MQSNDRLTYRGPRQHKYDVIDTFLYSVKILNNNTSVELIVGTKTLITYVYAIGSKSGLNISQFLQDRLCACRIHISIWFQAQ